MTDRRSIPELRAHADKVPGYGHLVAHEMVDEIEELRVRAHHHFTQECYWHSVSERQKKDAGWPDEEPTMAPKPRKAPAFLVHAHAVWEKLCELEPQHSWSSLECDLFGELGDVLDEALKSYDDKPRKRRRR